MNKKEVKVEELENANGAGPREPYYGRCPNCGKDVNKRTAENRTIQDGCDSYVEYKCGDCGTWFKN